MAALEGVHPETAGGVTIAAAEAARERGIIRDGDEVVILLTGNGLKTPGAATFDIESRPAERGRPGLAPVIARPLLCLRSLVRRMTGRRRPIGTHGGFCSCPRRVAAR